MSVKACARKGCENIMCDRYSPSFGYLCEECFEELVRLAELHRGVVDVYSFMRTHPNRIHLKDGRVRESMDKNFPKRID